MKIEMHAHTSQVSPCAWVPAAEVIRQYHKNGYQGIVITDHYNQPVIEGFPGSWKEKAAAYLKGYLAACEEAQKWGMTVLFGIETCLAGGVEDFLIYGASPDMILEYPKLYEMSQEELFHICDEMGVLLIQAHPFRSPCHMRDPRFLHGAEVYNGNPRPENHNELTERFVSAYPHYILTSGSDYHRLEDVGTGGIDAHQLIHSEKELRTILTGGNYELIRNH